MVKSLTAQSTDLRLCLACLNGKACLVRNKSKMCKKAKLVSLSFLISCFVVTEI